jgi:hypothetical protein
MELNLIQLKREFGSIYKVTIKDEDFIFRPLRLIEYHELVDNNKGGDSELEEKLCQIAVLEPASYSFSNSGKAGICKILSEHILLASGVADSRQLDLILEDHREQMRSFENQAETFISQAFHHISFDEMKQWTMDKLIQHVARAEWALQNVWQMPITFKSEVPPQTTEVLPEQSMKEMGDLMREDGLDPMIELDHLIRIKPPYVDFPMIGGTNLLSNEEALDNVRQQIQKLSQ